MPFLMAAAKPPEPVGCGPLALSIRDVAGFQLVDTAELGLPLPKPEDQAVTRAFQRDTPFTLVLLTVIVYEMPRDSADELGGFTEGMVEAQEGTNGETTIETNGVAYSGTRSGMALEAFEKTRGRYLAGAAVTGGADTGPESGGAIARDIVETQLDAISERCLSAFTPPSDSAEHTTAAYKAGRVAGRLMVVGLLVGVLVVIVRRLAD